MAQELCTMARALARSSVGQVSATSVAPVFHSPPMPRPSRQRNTASMAIQEESPEEQAQMSANAVEGTRDLFAQRFHRRKFDLRPLTLEEADFHRRVGREFDGMEIKEVGFDGE